MIDREPEYQDEVKCKNNDNSGIVIAKYEYQGEQCLDVRTSEDHICYMTKAKNWAVVRAAEDII